MEYNTELELMMGALRGSAYLWQIFLDLARKDIIPTSVCTSHWLLIVSLYGEINAAG